MEPKDTSKRHFNISILKSCLRLVAGTMMMLSHESIISSAGLFLIIAELAGIAEEL